MEKEMINLEEASVKEIAQTVCEDWKNVYFGAVPYLDAMATLESVNDNYYYDSGKSVVMYFLANAQTWRGEVARNVKKELNKRIK